MGKRHISAALDRFHAAHPDIAVQVNVTRHPYSFAGPEPNAWWKGRTFEEMLEQNLRSLGLRGKVWLHAAQAFVVPISDAYSRPWAPVRTFNSLSVRPPLANQWTRSD